MKRMLLLLIISLPVMLFSQVEGNIDDDFNNMLQVLEDETSIQEEGLFTLRFADAENDEPVKDATIDINNIGTYTTDAEGLVKLPLQKDGEYQFSFKKDGYIPADLTFEVAAGMIYFNRFSVSKLMDLGQIRIVLDWGNSPSDLDLHLEKTSHCCADRFRIVDICAVRRNNYMLNAEGNSAPDNRAKIAGIAHRTQNQSFFVFI